MTLIEAKDKAKELGYDQDLNDKCKFISKYGKFYLYYDGKDLYDILNSSSGSRKFKVN